jgi:2-polyprenyl-6-hydroxyphenyl methylase/3-demethylubiquinone-9 3-methyltransferase
MSNFNKSHSTIDQAEIEKFSAMADEWWDENGKFKPLHAMNLMRLEYIKNIATKQFNLKNTRQPFKGLQVLDIGCGGGLLSIPLAKMGAQVTAIDASEKNIMVARSYLERFPELTKKVNYIAADASKLLSTEKERYDMVFAMEVLEHVADVEIFLREAAMLLKKGGLFFASTINRTPESFAKAIVAAEYILKWLPKGTHSWKKFLRPSEIARGLRPYNVMPIDIAGMSYRLTDRAWYLSSDVSVNYIMALQKNSV